MRMKELQISSNGVLNFDTKELSGSCVIVISDGKVKLSELPPHADTIIKTYKGIVTCVNWDEGELF
ncbi:XtrA/YqaO family protein [Sporosarcina sp. FSL K6-1508]|uniref:XtrA/YqaO family protein n=1 Tax=Sporosarcina sp. FSL K6-1508 TaxID=2921553 RepID=UPI0030F6B762